MTVKVNGKRWSELNTAELAEATKEFDDPNYVPIARKPSRRALAELHRVQRKSKARERLNRMNPRDILEKLTTPEECEQFGTNVAEKFPEIAIEARRRTVQLRAKLKGAKSVVEHEALVAVYAYEASLAIRRGKKVRATRTWQMIERHGIIGAVERAVDRSVETSGFKELEAIGMRDLSFEAVVCRHPSAFGSAVVSRCEERLKGTGSA